MQKTATIQREELKETVKIHLEKNQKELKTLHDSRVIPGRALAQQRSDVIDGLIKQSLIHLGFSNFKNVSIVALGGYGREELCPYSDIDLLFLYEPKNKSLAKHAVESLLYLFWDLSLDIGHSVRTIDECLELSLSEDTTILTSLLDGRFVLGDKKLYDELEKKIFRELLPNVSSKYIERKIEENEKRNDKFGRSVYLLEPHLKEGQGGLREIHCALWIAQAKFKVKSFQELLLKGVLLERELRVFERELDFLLQIRSELHYLSGRREDRLSFDLQEKISSFLGYKDSGELRAVERFMRVYYLRANLIMEYSKKLIERCTIKPKTIFRAPKTIYLDNGFIIQGGMLSVSSRTIFSERPGSLMRAFEYAGRYEVKMSKYLVDLIRDNVNVIDENTRRSPELNASFLRLLKEGKEVANALFEMNRLRLLGRFIPEFGKIVCMVQHDAYHVYTVDVHSIFMVKEIENLMNNKYERELPLLTQTAKEVSNRHILYLACLFHDMGKGEGRNHAHRGAEMIPKISERIGLSREETEQLEFMVKHHLIMPHFSQRRDMHDDSLIIRFAKSVKTLETLSLLYLLSFADIKSVGPDVWTNWKGLLLDELYLRTRSVLEKGEFKREKPEDRAKSLIHEVIQIIKSKFPEDRIREHLDNMPYSYFLVFSPQKIAYHMNLIEKFKKGIGMDVIFHPNEEYDEFTFWGFDKVGIFSKLCGVIAASGINILGARIITRNDGRILDTFFVNRLSKSTFKDKEIWNKLWNALNRVLDGQVDVEELVSRRKKNKPIYEKTIPKNPTRIDIDNESSDRSTVIDIYTHDRIGLLYDITKTLANLLLSVDYAKISTKVDQVADVFYVSEVDGNKVLAPEKLEKIKTALLKAIDVDE
jgi:[protein-PII] uridylyltransferase